MEMEMETERHLFLQLDLNVRASCLPVSFEVVGSGTTVGMSKVGMSNPECSSTPRETTRKKPTPPRVTLAMAKPDCSPCPLGKHEEPTPRRISGRQTLEAPSLARLPAAKRNRGISVPADLSCRVSAGIEAP